jgi:hypothetical protein
MDSARKWSRVSSILATNGRRHGQITIQTPNPKDRLFLKIDLAAGVYLSEVPSSSRFLFRVVKQFCRF